MITGLTDDSLRELCETVDAAARLQSPDAVPVVGRKVYVSIQ